MEYRYNGEYNSKKVNNIKECVEYIIDIEYGQTIEHEKLAKILGYNISTDEEFLKYKAMMGKVRNSLLNYGRVLKSINGIGYYILKPKEISKHCYNTYIKQSSRIYDKSLFVLNKTDSINLSKDRKEELNNLIELNKNLIENVEKLTNESIYYNRKIYYDSLND